MNASFRAPSRKLALEQLCATGRTIVHVTPPCGLAGGRIYPPDTLPRHSVPCPCGKPDCWLVYYEKEVMPR